MDGEAPDRRALEARLDALERRVERLEGDTAPDTAGKIERLAAFEAEVLGALPDVFAVEPSVARGHPVLAEATEWGDLARASGAPAAAADAEAFVARLVGDYAEDARGRLERAGDDPFRALAEARAFDLEALARAGGPAPLADLRPRLRERFRARLEEAPPDDAARDAWTTELLDGADVVLTSADELPPRRERAVLDLVADDLRWHAAHVEREGGSRRRRLLRRLWRLRAERQERDLQHRLEGRFGARRVARFDKLVLWLIVLVVALFFVELSMDLTEREEFWFHALDTAACVVFLADFFVRLAYVRERAWWTARHFFVDFLPSIPAFVVLRPLRGLRLVRVFTRLLRVYAFLTRGVDRLVRKYGFLLNRNIVLYPTREERAVARLAEDGPGPRFLRVQARLHERWRRLLTTVPDAVREAVAGGRVAGLAAARAAGVLASAAAAPPPPPTPPRDVPADDVLHDLATLTAEEIEARMGQDFVVRVARAVRLFARFPFSWTPFLRRYVPRLGPGMSDAEVCVAAARQCAGELQRHHARWFWCADLYGTITPSQFVDRVGTAMVKASFRPAYRLVLFGLIVLVLKGVFGVSGLAFVEAMFDAIKNFLAILGTICFAVLGLGWWLRRIAGEATDFFAKSAQAQYLDLLESVKGRTLERDAAILDRHVFAAERAVQGDADGAGDQVRFVAGVRKWLMEAQPGDGITGRFDPVERAMLLYRDGLDGALLVANDTRTTRQLLGNPALRNLRLESGRFTRGNDKEVARLDLERPRALVRGPYLWFSLICQSVAHGVARLLVDYNRHALPLAQLAHATEAEKLDHAVWLGKERAADVPNEQVRYVTTHFTALHFLDDDPERDREVEARFGPDVLRRLRRDRRHLVRRIFGTYPLHQRPRDQRVVNLYRLYQRWFAGGRALFLPFRMVGLTATFVKGFFRWLRRCVKEIRHPSFDVDAEAVRGADFATALRKIGRMRDPVARSALRLRTKLDPEYVGVAIPGVPAGAGADVDGEAPVTADLEFLDAEPGFRRAIEKKRRRAARDVARFSRIADEAFWARVVPQGATPEHRRAAAAVYVADVREVRRHLSAREILGEAYERAAHEELRPNRLRPEFALHRRFRRYWTKHGRADRDAERAAWRVTLHNVDGARDALCVWDLCGGNEARRRGEETLRDILRYPERVTDQLVTLRCVQTLSLIDVLNYREHIYRLGQYAAQGDDPGGALELA